LRLSASSQLASTTSSLPDEPKFPLSATLKHHQTNKPFSSIAVRLRTPHLSLPKHKKGKNRALPGISSASLNSSISSGSLNSTSTSLSSSLRKDSPPPQKLDASIGQQSQQQQLSPPQKQPEQQHEHSSTFDSPHGLSIIQHHCYPLSPRSLHQKRIAPEPLHHRVVTVAPSGSQKHPKEYPATSIGYGKSHHHYVHYLTRHDHPELSESVTAQHPIADPFFDTGLSTTLPTVHHVLHTHDFSRAKNGGTMCTSQKSCAGCQNTITSPDVTSKSNMSQTWSFSGDANTKPPSSLTASYNASALLLATAAPKFTSTAGSLGYGKNHTHYRHYINRKELQAHPPRPHLKVDWETPSPQTQTR